MVVAGAAWIETGIAVRALEAAAQIFADGGLVAARAAEDCSRVPLRAWPYRRRVVGALGVALVTRVPPFTTVESDCDDVVFAMPVGATGKVVHRDAVHTFTVDALDQAFVCVHHSPGTKMAMTIVIGMLSGGFSLGWNFQDGTID